MDNNQDSGQKPAFKDTLLKTFKPEIDSAKERLQSIKEASAKTYQKFAEGFVENFDKIYGASAYTVAAAWTVGHAYVGALVMNSALHSNEPVLGIAAGIYTVAFAGATGGAVKEAYNYATGVKNIFGKDTNPNLVPNKAV